MNLYKESQPSLEAYMNAYNGPDRIHWYPYNATQMVPVEEQQQLKQLARETPPEQFMYGM